ncbi:MAG: endonuclease V [Hyphomicrobiaceae bacterium]
MIAPPVHIALDVSYADDSAFAVGLAFEHWQDAHAVEVVTLERSGAADYVPGSFYLRELPCLQAVLERLLRTPATLIIDGYVTLGRDNRPGLGYRLWDRLDRAVPVIGVAKSRYAGTPDEAALLRGRSIRPLYISTVGLELSEAKARIAGMHGRHRLPTLLKLADTLARARTHSAI